MKWLVIGVVFIVYVFEMFVSILNHKYRVKPTPNQLKDIYDEERYQKWLAYSMENHRFSMIKKGFDLIVLVSFLLFGVFSYLEQLTLSLTDNKLLSTLYFLGIYETFEMILGIPFKYYGIFTIEERYGFNKTTIKTFIKDIVIGFLMMVILGGLVISGIYQLYVYFIDNLWVFVFMTWGAIVFTMLFVSLFLNKLFLRIFNTLKPLPEGTLRYRIEELSLSCGFNIKALYSMDASRRTTKLNAFFTGIGKSREVVLYDTLLEKMSDDEILAVLAHELGHAVHKDTWKMILQQVCVVFLYTIGIGFILQSESLATSFGFSGIHFGFAVILFAILFEPISILIGIPQNALSRKAEYKADAFSKSKMSGKAMISALKVLSREDLVNLNPHPLAVLLYYSHPPMKDRIEAIEKE